MPKSYKVGFTDKALGDIEDLSAIEYDRILKGCLRLQENPEADGKHVKKLRGYKDLYVSGSGITGRFSSGGTRQ